MVWLLAACAPAYPTVVPAAATQAQAPETPPAQPPAPAPVPQVLPAPPLRSPIPQPQPGDQCGAMQARALIGRPRTLIPVPLDPRRQRVACTTCPITEDFDPSRLNFFFDAQSGLIRQVRCG
jgi:hypothetical protein